MYKITLPGGLAMMHKRIYRKDSLIKKMLFRRVGIRDVYKLRRRKLLQWRGRACAERRLNN